MPRLLAPNLTRIRWFRRDSKIFDASDRSSEIYKIDISNPGGAGILGLPFALISDDFVCNAP